MTSRLRLNAELVRRGLARSRVHAGSLICGGHVLVAGHRATKPAAAVSVDQRIVVKDSDNERWTSRGAHRLLGALEMFEPRGLSVAGRRCLDTGASTGGFTDVLLRRDASEVIAVDVGYAPLVEPLRNDERVQVMDCTNVRYLTADEIGGPVSLTVSDLSSISLKLVMSALAGVTAPEGDIVLMIKPRFEVGRENLGKNGVMREPAFHAEAVLAVCESAYQVGWGTAGLAPSPLPGPAGNVEYFCWLRADAPPPTASAAHDVAADRPLPASGGRS